MLKLQLLQVPSKVFLVHLVALCLALLAWLWETPARGAEVVTFPHGDERYLLEGQHEGGAAFIPDGAVGEKRVPVVVFLHGTNRAAIPHLWLGGGGRDLRPLVQKLVRTDKVRPFVLAAPSQTSAANHGESLWSGFDLARFVMDLGDRIAGRATLDLGSIYLFGHSGAGCNPEGGLTASFHQERALRPAAVVAIDPCLDEEMGVSLAQRPAGLPLWVLWQSRVWRRDYPAWSTALALAPAGAGEHHILHLVAPGPNPHDSIVPIAFDLIVRKLIPRSPEESEESGEQHSGA